MRPTRSFSHIGEDALYHVAEDIKQAMLELAYMTEEIDSMNFEQLRRKIDANCVIRPIPVHFPGAIQSPNEA